MESLVISLNAVLPMFLMMAAGYVMKGKGWFTDDALNQINKLVFRLLLPVQVFKSTFLADLEQVMDLRFMGVNVALTVGSFLVMAVLVARFVHVPSKKGALVQGMYRGTLALIGMSLAESLFGPENTGMMAIIVAVLVPTYNILAVLTLEGFRGGQPAPGKLAKEILTNPLIVGCCLGLLANVADLSLPLALTSVMNSLGGAATPVALIALGASFHIEQVSSDKAYIAVGVLTKLVLLPALVTIVGVALGYRGVELGTMVIANAAPVAVASFPMAQQMGADADLTASLIVFSGMFSCFTIFLWIFTLLQLGLL